MSNIHKQIMNAKTQVSLNEYKNTRRKQKFFAFIALGFHKRRKGKFKEILATQTFLLSEGLNFITILWEQHCASYTDMAILETDHGKQKENDRILVAR